MPRRATLSSSDRTQSLAVPDSPNEWIQRYTFSEADNALIRRCGGDANRLGFAVQLCLLRYPGQGFLIDADVAMPLIKWIARQIHIDPRTWLDYAERDETRRGFVANSAANSCPLYFIVQRVLLQKRASFCTISNQWL